MPLPIEPEGTQVETAGDVSVSAAILTDEDAAEHFGVSLAKGNLQALWLSIHNNSDKGLWLIRNAVHPDFFPADEAVQMLRSEIPSSDFEVARRYFRDESIRVFIQPKSVTEGFLYLPRAEGGRYIDIRLAMDAFDKEVAMQQGVESGRLDELRFGFAIPLPDGLFDYEKLDTRHTYENQELPDLSLDELRERLRALPCCASNKDGTEFGDPLNVVVVADGAELLNSLSRAGWSFTHRITLSSVRRMIGAAIQHEGYPVAPVSNLYLFGRKQDFALQRARAPIAQRNHMRFWLAPFSHNGKQVWVGQISRDIGVKLTTKAPTLTTHVIDPEVDLTREYLLHSLLAEGFVRSFGFVDGSRAATPENPATNLTGDPWFSDGMRLVILLSPDPIPYREVRSLQWDRSSNPVAEGQSKAASRYVRPISN